jgi:hypothetical protein
VADQPAGNVEEEGARYPHSFHPDDDEQRQFLNSFHRKWWRAGEKATWKALQLALRAGDAAGVPRIYQAVLETLQTGKTPRDLPILPRSWWEWRLEHADRHHWSIGGFFSSLYQREGLVQHCQIQLREHEKRSRHEQPTTPDVHNGTLAHAEQMAAARLREQTGSLDLSDLPNHL